MKRPSTDLPRSGGSRFPGRLSFLIRAALAPTYPKHDEDHVARIAGVNIPSNKRVEIGLRYIHGIGPPFAKEICEKVNIPAARRSTS